MSRSAFVKNLPLLVGASVILAGMLLLYLFFEYISADDTPAKKVVPQQITLLPPPPPPPPPPPEIEPEVEPELEEEVVEETPPEMPDEAMDEVAGEDLGLDADGGAGSDSFGLVGRKGGRGLGLGKAGHYEVMVKEKLIDGIYEHNELKYHAYSAVIKIWIAPSGAVDRFEIQLQEKSAKVHELLASLVSGLRFNNGPPLELTDRSINLKVNSRI